MKDIKLDTRFKKIQNGVAWFGFIAGGTLIMWLIALYLGSYGKTTSLNSKKKKDLLNKTWQKFVFIYGSIIGDIIIIAFLIGIVFA